MNKMELKFLPTLKNAQMGTIAAAKIASAFYDLIKNDESDHNFSADVELAVGEACTNCVKYSENPDTADKTVIVTFETDDKKLVIQIKDQNPEFDFNGVSVPDFSEVPESGYGIFIIKEKMDLVTYMHTDGWNCVTMTKFIESP